MNCEADRGWDRRRCDSACRRREDSLRGPGATRGPDERGQSALLATL